ncbi:MAG: T9SS type A sorting domain-containing protein [Bacteroidetes bacterium]|nr:T9SS type A sorting domain-containing protein [Bacteroidota bacterium]MCL1968774.1 T9SS type A sorting domain-containing protein [Bacteroidota bacterium]
MKKIFILLLVACFTATLFAQRAVPRYTFLEMFTSATCPPCYQGNVNLHNMLNQNNATGGKYTLIKYQMSWPGVGDPYYTAEGGVRRSVYSINGVPNLCMDGVNRQTSFNNNMLLQAQAVPAYMEVYGNYNVVGHTVSATIHIRPTMDITIGNNLKLYVAIVEKRTVNNIMSNGETLFYQVMKKFMPDANGIILGNLTACELITHELTWEFQGNYRLPANSSSPINHTIEHSVENFDNLEVVAWVANTSNRQIYNSCTAIRGNSFAINFYVFNADKGTLTATVDDAPIQSGELVTPGTVVNFTAVPNTNYYVKEWVVNGCDVVEGNNSNSFSITMDDSQIVAVQFIRDYNVNFGTANEYGSITATVNGAPINSGDNIQEGSAIDFTAVPNEGYEVKEWIHNGAVVPDNTTNNFSITVNGEENVSVEFIEIKKYGSVTYNVIDGNGSLTATVAGEPFESGIDIEFGTVIEFTATPNEGYIVKEWKHNNEVVADNTTTNFSLTVSGNEIVTVEFEELVGINVINLFSVELCPNPVTNELIIKNAEQVQKVSIANTLGQIIKEEILSGENNVVISTQNLQSGILFVTLKDAEGHEITKKIVKK